MSDTTSQPGSPDEPAVGPPAPEWLPAPHPWDSVEEPTSLAPESPAPPKRSSPLMVAIAAGTAAVVAFLAVGLSSQWRLHGTRPTLSATAAAPAAPVVPAVPAAPVPAAPVDPSRP